MGVLMRGLRNDNFALSGGYITEGAGKLYIRSMSRFRSLAEIEETPVPGKPGLVLRDIASIQYGEPEQRWMSRIDGRPSVMMGVYNESTANIVAVTRAVEEELRNVIATNPRLQGMDVKVLFSQGEQITESLEQLQSAGLWGGLFALLVVFFFLRRLRMTILINAAIPLSMLMALTVLYFMGLVAERHDHDGADHRLRHGGGQLHRRGGVDLRAKQRRRRDSARRKPERRERGRPCHHRVDHDDARRLPAADLHER